jgi:thiol:disulfide interchange protein DsbD
MPVLCALAALLIFAGEANSQVPSISLNNMERPKTELFYSQETPAKGDTLYLKVTIPEGWHINANSVLDDFLIASSVEPIANGIEFDSVLWPTPLKIRNEVLNMDLLLLQDSFIVKLPVNSISEGADPYSVKLSFTYQACSNICLAPKTIEVSFSDKGTALQPLKKKNELNSTAGKKNSFIAYFFLAMLGGLLLNFMPCVLPVLFPKISELIKKHGATRHSMLRWGFAMTSGICFTFFVFAMVICIIRLTGNAVGWGFQFQYPAYTATMALLIGIFALNIWGVFEVWMPGNVLNVWEKHAKKTGFFGAFANGIFLVLMSTSCSAPFLGTAVGFAFSASAFDLFIIFFAVAIGLSSPYLVLSVFPQWTHKLPRPGHWMVVLKQFLGFPLLLTLVWLVWIFCRQAGIDATLKLVLLLCAASFFAWLSGLIAKPGKPWWHFALLWLIFILIYVFSWKHWVSPQLGEANYTATHSEETDWLPFSREKLDSLQNIGYAVWINGTADWCITCKINEKNVFESEKIKKAFEEVPIVKMRADYTNSNSNALKFFEEYGRSGVPFDLLLTSGGEPILMSELLREEAVIEALGRAY